MSKHSAHSARFSYIILVLAIGVFLGLGAYQLHLPGLHYDEAKEAGLNAMELVTGQSVTAFRDATIMIGPWRLPLMVQDYIGALNVILALPFLTIGGVNVVALRWLPLLIGALTLLVTWRIAWRLGGAVAASATVCLLAVNPAFIFWSRQGIFVTNLITLIFMASLLTGLRWWQMRRPRDLWLTAFLWGLGIYAKLLFVWAIGALLIIALAAWLLKARSSKLEAGDRKLGVSRSQAEPPGGTQQSGASLRHGSSGFKSGVLTWAFAAFCFVLPLVPLIIFNLRTGGTLKSVFGNLDQSYYGVDNSAYLPNLATRLGQLVTLLRGDHLGYLGGPFANTWAPWILGLILLSGLALGLSAYRQGSRREGQREDRAAPLLGLVILCLILLLIVAQSAFTVSDLFITHYALLLPLLPLIGGLAFGVIWTWGEGEHARQGGKIVRGLALIALVAWIGSDLVTDIRYHRALTATGGHGSHSDAIHALAKRLDSLGWDAPVALDWGLAAQIRYLTAGRVQPIEVFGYESLDGPDPGYAERMNKLLDDPDNFYLAHPPERTNFRERVNALADLAWNRGLTLREQGRFNEQDGTPLIILYRAEK